MIRYALTCPKDHSFESWFQSADAFDRLTASGLVSCTVCGATEVTKSLMAPAVRPARKAGEAEPAPRPLSAPANPAEEALAALRRKVEENSEYVGMNFAAEARAIHDGDAPGRAIYGEARLDEAKKLIEDGVPVAPLPFMPGRKTN
ncbi:DUF1178 family protein [Frigidibacter sp.]|uniref:DUF1178 family protein n=1 Tax=Frigidibacter sp. TaxID=2586418 RepID=UPI0027376652|nr:DUF1178 family protein [Frigidibacter sp.]MDP3338765.1 DUF1178 family protein [Frigidibacter sp.]